MIRGLSFFTLKYLSSEEGCQAFIRHPALPLEQNVFVVHTRYFFP
jgi:hypothetical protein